jgi:PqqD family protein of HPr-rel-A system
VEGDNAEFGDEQVVARTDESLSATLDGEAVLLQPEAGMYYGMNDVATVLWERLEEPATVADLRAELRSEFDVEAAVADRDLRAFLADLEAADLVEIRDPSDAA